MDSNEQDQIPSKHDFMGHITNLMYTIYKKTERSWVQYGSERKSAVYTLQ